MQVDVYVVLTGLWIVGSVVLSVSSITLSVILYRTSSTYVVSGGLRSEMKHLKADYETQEHKLEQLNKRLTRENRKEKSTEEETSSVPIRDGVELLAAWNSKKKPPDAPTPISA